MEGDEEAFPTYAVVIVPLESSLSAITPDVKECVALTVSETFPAPQLIEGADSGGVLVLIHAGATGFAGIRNTPFDERLLNFAQD